MQLAKNNIDLGFFSLPVTNKKVGYMKGHFVSKNRNYRPTPFSYSEFVKNATKIHGELYDYSLSNVIDNRHKVNVLCKNCGSEFHILPANHIYNGVGCVGCYGNVSKGEKKINDFLKEKKIAFKREYSFNDLKGHRFDFYISDRKILIEYDGEQHFRPVDFFGGGSAFEMRKRKDQIKNKYASDKGIRLLRIPYNERNNIENILNEVI